MGLATLADLTPTTAHEVETRHRALDPRIRAKHAALDAQRDARHAVVEALGMKLRALREELVTKKRRLADSIANATPAWSHGESQPGGGAGAVVTSGGFPDRAVREAEVARLAENLQHAEAAYQAASVRWASIARIVENCRAWIEATPIAAIVPVVVTYERIADPRCEVEAIRAKIITLGEEAAEVEGGPVSLADALGAWMNSGERLRNGWLPAVLTVCAASSHRAEYRTSPGSVSPRATDRSGGSWRRRFRKRQMHASSPTSENGGARSRPPRSPASRCRSPNGHHGSRSLRGTVPS